MIINSWKLFGRRREEQGNDIDKMANIIPIAIKDDLFGFMKRDRLPLYVLKTAEYDMYLCVCSYFELLTYTKLFEQTRVTSCSAFHSQQSLFNLIQ